MTIQGPVTEAGTDIHNPMFDVKSWDVESKRLGDGGYGYIPYESNVPEGAELEFVRTTYQIDNGAENELTGQGFEYNSQTGTMQREKTLN